MRCQDFISGHHDKETTGHHIFHYPWQAGNAQCLIQNKALVKRPVGASVSQHLKSELA